MTEIILIIFFLVYLGMIFGSWPGLALDRTGIALLGAIAIIGLGNIPISNTVTYIDWSAIAILFSFMIISAQFYYSGFYTRLVENLQKWELTPSQFLFAVIFISGFLSAVLINDIVCLALTPLIIKGCSLKKLKPLPFLLGLALASNIGSAFTLIGNPQNILIGQVIEIPFANYMKYSIVPCLLGLIFTWFIIKLQSKGNWRQENQGIEFETIHYNRWQSNKGIIVLLILLAFFFILDISHEKISLIVAGFLLLSRRMASQMMLNFIDWQLLVLFIGLFIVNGGLFDTGIPTQVVEFLGNYHIDLHSSIWIFIAAIFLSNIVSNVPAAMLILPFIDNNFDGSLLAMSSTLAGNMFIVGSIANLIVISQASKFDIKISWKDHIRVGLPVTIVTLSLTALWFYFV